MSTSILIIYLKAQFYFVARNRYIDIVYGEGGDEG